MLADSPANSCVALLVSLVDFWIDGMAEIFPKTSAGIPNAQIDFEQRKDSNMHTFIDSFVGKENFRVAYLRIYQGRVLEILGRSCM